MSSAYVFILELHALNANSFVSSGLSWAVSSSLCFQSVEHLSWLGLFKDLSEGTHKPSPFYHKRTLRKTKKECEHVREKFLQMRHVHRQKIQGKKTAPVTINACFVPLCSSLEVSEEVRQYLKTPTFDNWRVYHKCPFPQCTELWELRGCAPNENDRCVSRWTSPLADALVSIRIGAQESKDRLHDRLHQRGVWSGGASLCSVKRFNRCGKRNNQSQLQEGFTSCGWRRLFNIFLLLSSYKTKLHICCFSFPKWDSGLLLNFFPNFNLLMFYWFLQRKT